jgi:hypothetical protein
MKSSLRMTGLVDFFTASGLYRLRKNPFKLSFRARSPGEESRFEYSQRHARFLALRPRAFGPAPADPSPEGGFGPQGEGPRPAGGRRVIVPIRSGLLGMTCKSGYHPDSHPQPPMTDSSADTRHERGALLRVTRHGGLSRVPDPGKTDRAQGY